MRKWVARIYSSFERPRILPFSTTLCGLSPSSVRYKGVLPRQVRSCILKYPPLMFWSHYLSLAPCRSDRIYSYCQFVRFENFVQSVFYHCWILVRRNAHLRTALTRRFFVWSSRRRLIFRKQFDYHTSTSSGGVSRKISLNVLGSSSSLITTSSNSSSEW